MTDTGVETTSFMGDLVDNIEERIARIIERITPKEKRYPPFLQFADAVTAAQQGGVAVLCLKGPTRGRFWYVRKLRISGVTPIGASSNNEWTFSGTNVATPTFSNGGTLQSGSFLYTTDGVAGNRTIVLTITEANNRILYQIVSPFGQPPSTATEYSFAPGVQATANGSPVSVTLPIPPGLVIPPGGHITITAQGSDPGDTITAGTALLSGSTRADVFVCPDDLRGVTALAQCPITSWKDQLLTIPQVQSYGVGELKVSSQEQLWVVVSNGAISAQNFVASCEAYEWPDQDENVEWVI